MKKRTISALAALAATASLVAAPASAYDKGDWRTTIGITNIQPDNPVLDDGATVDDATQLSFTGAYFFTDSLALELLASLPFQHDVSVPEAGAGISIKHLPPTLSLQWHFNNSSPVTPYVGAGANWTIFFDETGYGALAGADVELDDSFGYALQAGLDYAFTDNLFMNVDVRYIDIESDVKIGGSDIGKADINPVTAGVSIGYKF